jgi:hypothetical protein
MFWRLERVRMLAKKMDVASRLAFIEQEYAAASSAGAGGPSDADNAVTAMFWRLERVRMLAKKRDVESRLAFIEQECAAALGRVIAVELVPVGRPAKRAKVEVAGKCKGGVRADDTGDEGIAIDDATDDEGSEECAGISKFRNKLDTITLVYKLNLLCVARLFQ